MWCWCSLRSFVVGDWQNWLSLLFICVSIIMSLQPIHLLIVLELDTNSRLSPDIMDSLDFVLCLVLLQVPKCFGLVQILYARPKIHLHIVAVTNILCQTNRWFAFSKIVFCASTNVFEEALNAVKSLGWLKKFGQAQNILGPVKGQGIILMHSKIFQYKNIYIYIYILFAFNSHLISN